MKVKILNLKENLAHLQNNHKELLSKNKGLRNRLKNIKEINHRQRIEISNLKTRNISNYKALKRNLLEQKEA